MWIPGWILLSPPRELPSHTLLQSGRADSFKMVQGGSFMALRPSFRQESLGHRGRFMAFDLFVQLSKCAKDAL